MMKTKHIVFLFNLLQDVNILRPLAYLAAREFDVSLTFLVSINLISRDRERTWQREIAEIAGEVGALLHTYASPLDAVAVLQGKHGVILAGSESSLRDHALTHDVFRAAPASFLKVTLQHGYECVGFLQSRQHDVAHGRHVTFAADVACAWCPPNHLKSLAISERPKIYVTGPSTILQTARVPLVVGGGLVCENLHSARLRASGNFGPSFLESFFEFCDRLALRGQAVSLRPHPGGQFVLRHEVPLPPNVVINNRPIYKVGLSGFEYGISAPSTVLIDMVLADIPVAMWRDHDGVIDIGNYAGLIEIRGVEDWLAFTEQAAADPEAAKTPQRRFIERLSVLTDRAEVYRRFARLLGSTDGISASSGGAWRHALPGRLARRAEPLNLPATTERRSARPLSPPERDRRENDDRAAADHPSRADAAAAERILLLTDVAGATQTINFMRPLSAAIAAGEVALKIVEETEIHGDAVRRAGELWERFAPTLLILSRYTEDSYGAFVDRARRAGIAIVYHIDDDLLAVPDTLGFDKFSHYNAPQRLRNMRGALAASDLIYASTSPLGARMRGYGLGPEVVAGVIACAMDPGGLHAPRPSQRRTIGYAATGGHGRDLDLALDGLVQSLEAFPDLSFELFGSLRMPDALARFGSRVIKRDQVADYDAFLAGLGELGWWVGIAPLEDNPFNACKTETKWLEYTFAGIPTLASNVAVYRRCCQSGAGLLVSNGASWAAAIEQLLRDEELRGGIVRRAQMVAADHYSLGRLEAQLREVFRHARENAIRRKSWRIGAPPAAAVSAPVSAPVVRSLTEHPHAAQPPGPRPGEYRRWIDEFDTLSDGDRIGILRAVAALPRPPLVSIVLVGTGGAEALARTVEALNAQLYQQWELLTSAKLDPRALPRCELRQLRRRATLAELIQAAKGDYVGFVEIGDTLADHALAFMALATVAWPDAQLFFSDEDELAGNGQRENPYFKSGWDPDLLLASDYPCRLALVATSIARRAAPKMPPGAPAVHTLLLEGFGGIASAQVHHVPFVLYHRAEQRAARLAPPGVSARAAFRALGAAANAGTKIATEVQGDGQRRIVWPLPVKAPRVSAVIPTRDRVDLLKRCVEGLLRETEYPDLEIVILDNGSTEEETREYFRELAANGRVRIIAYPHPFNYSAINNVGVKGATGEIVALLNNDLEIIHAGWLKEMVAQALRPDVGAVGALLLYPDDTVQHAGIVLGVGTASHLLKGQPVTGPGYGGRTKLAHEVAAVTAACLVLRRDVWEAVGGLDENFRVAYNDVDLCLRIREAGYRVVWTPFACLYHHESASRGSDKGVENRIRLDEEKRRLRARWGHWIDDDPFFSPNLSLKSLDCRPAFPPRVEKPWQGEKGGAAKRA